MDQIKIGKFIATLRKEKSMTQQELAEKIGVSYKTISKWETGRGMPDLSLLRPLSEALDITINELLSGEKLEDKNYINKLEENMINTIEYSEEQKEEQKKQNNKIIGIVLMLFGFFITLTALSIFPSESSWNSIYSIIGVIISLMGFSRLLQKLKCLKRIILCISIFVILVSLLITIDFISVVNNNQPPRFSYLTETLDKMIVYNAPFYKVYRINTNTSNEYYIIDTKNEYSKDTVPISPFNHNKSGMENILKYQNKYVGNNSNIGNLINKLPLSEYGYEFEIDSNNLGVIIDYHITDWYISDNLYMQKCLIYNSISIFSLIENVEFIKYNFTGNSYTISRKLVEEKYPSYLELKSDDKMNIKNFEIYVEYKMNDPEFVENIFKDIFDI